MRLGICEIAGDGDGAIGSETTRVGAGLIKAMGSVRSGIQFDAAGTAIKARTMMAIGIVINLLLRRSVKIECPAGFGARRVPRRVSVFPIPATLSQIATNKSNSSF